VALPCFTHPGRQEGHKPPYSPHPGRQEGHKPLFSHPPREAGRSLFTILSPPGEREQKRSLCASLPVNSAHRTVHLQHGTVGRHIYTSVYREVYTQGYLPGYTGRYIPGYASRVYKEVYNPGMPLGCIYRC